MTPVANQPESLLPAKVVLEKMTIATAKTLAPRAVKDARLITREVSKDFSKRFGLRYAELQMVDLSMQIEFFAVCLTDPNLRASVWVEEMNAAAQSFDESDPDE